MWDKTRWTVEGNDEEELLLDEKFKLIDYFVNNIKP